MHNPSIETALTLGESALSCDFYSSIINKNLTHRYLKVNLTSGCNALVTTPFIV